MSNQIPTMSRDGGGSGCQLIGALVSFDIVHSQIYTQHKYIVLLYKYIIKYVVFDYLPDEDKFPCR
jgi:hypothetical protein